MNVLVVIAFVLGYVVIALEQWLNLNKAAPALFTGIICWTIYILSGVDQVNAGNNLLQNLSDISVILFFLLGAMAIVGLIALHKGFDLVTNKIKTKSKAKLLWIIFFTSFSHSAILNNMITAIVMTSLTEKLLQNKIDRLWFAGMIIIAANAGGTLSPIGGVTTERH